MPQSPESSALPVCRTLLLVALAATTSLHGQQDEWGPVHRPDILRQRLEWLKSRGIALIHSSASSMRHEYERRRAEARQVSALAVAGTSWKSLGPTNGAGRISSIAFHPSDPLTVFIAAAGGGVWKTTDGGTTWRPLTDDIGTVGIGAVAVDPTNPDIIYHRHR